mmetsp:Transcript_7339/g.23912  ORF Transcript_7339/g.23912 Transcript_7339/m.23912 type:complete len:271 (+) Transcript_7339:201-1013(+)
MPLPARLPRRARDGHGAHGGGPIQAGPALGRRAGRAAGRALRRHRGQGAARAAHPAEQRPAADRRRERARHGRRTRFQRQSHAPAGGARLRGHRRPRPGRRWSSRFHLARALLVWAQRRPGAVRRRRTQHAGASGGARRLRRARADGRGYRRQASGEDPRRDHRRVRRGRHGLCEAPRHQLVWHVALPRRPAGVCDNDGGDAGRGVAPLAGGTHGGDALAAGIERRLCRGRGLWPLRRDLQDVRVVRPDASLRPAAEARQRGGRVRRGGV